MHRFYVNPPAVDSNELRLAPEDAHHAVHVLRLKEGTTVELILEGQRFQAVLSRIRDEEVLLTRGKLLPSTEPTLSITLFQGLPKADKMDWIVQKASELGAVRLVPVRMSRCVSRPDEKEGHRKVERWRKIAREAGKQSGRCVIPDITDPVPLSRIAPLLSRLDAAVVPWEEARSKGPISWQSAHSAIRSLGIIIGPEGGISMEEIDMLQKLGCEPITLGPRILRTETAGLACISAFLTLFGEME